MSEEKGSKNVIRITPQSYNETLKATPKPKVNPNEGYEEPKTTANVKRTTKPKEGETIVIKSTPINPKEEETE